MITVLSHHLVFLTILSYLVCGIATERRFTSWMYYTYDDDEPAWTAFLGIVAGIFWPITIIGYFGILMWRVGRLLSRYGLARKIFFAEPKERWDLNSSGRRRLEDVKKK